MLPISIFFLLLLPLSTKAIALSKGRIFTGGVALAGAGNSVATGDLNGDGLDEIIVGASDDNDAGNDAGAVYILYPPFHRNVTSLSRYIKYTGENRDDELGKSVATGDVNGDGYDDVIIGAPSEDTVGHDAGAAYIIYGQGRRLGGGSIARVEKLLGERGNDKTGYSVAANGNVNNDGYDDILIGSYEDSSASQNSGSVYLVYGRAMQLNTNTLRIFAEFTGEYVDDNAGSSVAFGDINGDGYSDILVGAINAGNARVPFSGAVYIIYGQATSFSSTSSTSLSGGVKFVGENDFDDVGFSIGSGDLNADGYDEMIVGALGYDGMRGAAYVVYGASSTLTSASLKTAVKYEGEDANDFAGYSVASSDYNHDGYSDLFISALLRPYTSGQNGEVYLLEGSSSSLSGGSLASASLSFTGEYNDAAGSSLAFGDFNGDSYDDMVVGANENGDGAFYGGAVYLFYGQ